MEKHDMEHHAVLAALAFGRQHSYVTPGFKPHDWVLEAMMTVYRFGFSDGHDEGYSEGRTDAEAERE